MKKFYLLVLAGILLFAGCSPTDRKPDESQAETADVTAVPETETPETAAPPQTEPETEAETEPETEAQPGLPTLMDYQYSDLIYYNYPGSWRNTKVIRGLSFVDGSVPVSEQIEEDYERICGFLPYKDCWYKWTIYNAQLPDLYYYIRAYNITREQFETEYARLLAEQIEQGGDDTALYSDWEDFDYLIYSDEDLDALFGGYDEETFKEKFKSEFTFEYEGVLYRVYDLMYLAMVGGYDDLLRDMAINGGLIEHLEFFADPPYRILESDGNEYDRSRMWDFEAFIPAFVDMGDGEGYYDLVMSDPVKTITLREFYVKVKALAEK